MDENLEAELYEQEPVDADLSAEDADLDLDLDDEDEDWEDEDWSEQDERDYLAERQAEYDDLWGDALSMPSYAS